jgi:hypothetical protein
MNPTTVEHGIRGSADRLEEVVRRLDSSSRGGVAVDISMSLDGYVTAAGAPVVLGDGTPLWPAGAPLSLQLLHSESTAAAEHLTYRVVCDG